MPTSSRQQLDVVLTSRNVAKGQRVPMAGVPHHAAEGYIAKLIDKGLQGRHLRADERRADQWPDAAGGGARGDAGHGGGAGPAGRQAQQLPGGVVRDGHSAGIAYVDITTGELATTQFSGPRRPGACCANWIAWPRPS